MRRDRGRKPRRKVCVFCADHIDQIDYKDVAKLRRFTTERGKILPRRISCLLYTSPSPRDVEESRMPSSA